MPGGDDPPQLGDDHGHRLVVVDGRSVRGSPRVGLPVEIAADSLLRALHPALTLRRSLPVNAYATGTYP